MGPQQLLRSLGSLVARIRDEIETPTASSAAVPSVPGYTVIRHIGKGGMGTVYLARDETLGRNVAIKFVSGFVPGDRLARRQFLTEAKAMASVSHANIVHVYAFGESDGLPYIVMEHVEGRSLGRLLRESGRLPEAQAIDIVDQTANALEAAWEQGIVHGDVKPSNILIDSKGVVRVCDFGLARPKPTDLPTAPRQSSPVAGTPHYMSPEQAAGRPTDLRSDLYSLGVVLYEMLVGSVPFASMAPFDVLRHSGDPLPPLEQARPVSQPVSELYHWMTRPNPGERPASHAALRQRIASLRASRSLEIPSWPSLAAHRVWSNPAYLAVALLSVVAVSAGLIAFFYNPELAPTFAHVISISDFENRTGDPDLDDLGPALRHEVERSLIGSLQGFIVIPPRLSSEPEYFESETEPELLLAGTFTGSREDLRIEYNLRDLLVAQDIGDDAVRGDGSDERLPELQRRLATSVAAMLVSEFGDAAFEEHDNAAQDAEANIAYQRGAYYLRGAETVEQLDDAIELLQRATSLEATFASAHAALGRALWGKYRLTGDPALIARARDSCDEAKRRDEMLADGYVCSGWINIGRDRYAFAFADFAAAIERGAPVEAHRGLGVLLAKLGDDELAEAYLLEARNRDPSYPGAYLSLGYFYAKRDRYTDGLEWYERAASYTPSSAWALTSIGASYFMLGQYADAANALDASIGKRATEDAWSNLGLVHLARGDFDQAVEAFEEAVRFEHADYISYGNLARAYHWAGAHDSAVRNFREAADRAEYELEINERALYPKILLAYYYVMLGDRAGALQMLERAIGETRSDSAGEVHYWAAIVHLELGEREKAIQSLRTAREDDYSVFELRDAPEFGQLVSEPEYMAIVRGGIES